MTFGYVTSHTITVSHVVAIEFFHLDLLGPLCLTKPVNPYCTHLHE